MAGRIRDEDIAAIRERSPIDEVVGEYLQLRNAGGGSLKGLCPFHEEKTPSFNVTPARGLFYCLAGETRVLTWEGVKPIRELAGGTHRILGKHGDWIDAPFRSFGVQPLIRLTVTRNGISKHIYATAEHRWFVRSGKTQRSDREVLTSNLRPGHRLVSKFPRTRVKQTTPSPFGIAHGVTFGDGTRSGSGSMAQLDAVKDVELLKWFPVSMMTQHGRQLLIHHLPRFFKELPSQDESVSYLYGWLAGYFAADGCISTTGTIMLNSARRDELEYVRLVCTRLGIGTYGVTEQVRVGFPGMEPTSLFRIILVGSDLTEEFFLLDKHRLRFNAAAKAYERKGWVVREVARTDRVEEVFCATVEEGHAFTLEDNILTGNCFSCAEGGDAIKFVQKIDGLSFVEAVERLAARAGVELRYEQGGYVPGQEQSQRRRLIEAHRAAAEYYAERLDGSDAAPARAFLAERGFELADIQRFGVGYSPKAWEDLTRHLRGRGFTDSELIAAGLSREGNRGARDRFRGRLMWPIRDLSGDVIAFGARKLDPDDDGPKYLNTPETSLFRKSTVLYGADLAKREIAQRRQAVIVEGYTDVMACHLAGVPTAVATCGTSFGEDHIKVLRRLIVSPVPRAATRSSSCRRSTGSASSRRSSGWPRAGVELRYEQGGYVPGQEQSQRRRLIEAHRAAAEYYAERLGGSDAAPARAFLAERRGFELADIQRFGVGYSPKAWEDLTRHLRGRGFTDSELIAAGLSREGNRGARDRFRGRPCGPSAICPATSSRSAPASSTRTTTGPST